MSDDNKNLWACLGVLFVLVSIPLIAIFQGWVLTVLWGWFVVPTFALPKLSIAVAIGLTLIVGMFKSYQVKNEEKSTEDKVVEWVAGILVPLFILFLGWIVHLFM